MGGGLARAADEETGCGSITQTTFNLVAPNVTYSSACQAEYSYNEALSTRVPTIYGPYNAADGNARMHRPPPVRACMVAGLASKILTEVRTVDTNRGAHLGRRQRHRLLARPDPERRAPPRNL